MKKILGIFFFYILLAVLLLPMAATCLFGSFGGGLPRQTLHPEELHFASVE